MDRYTHLALLLLAANDVLFEGQGLDTAASAAADAHVEGKKLRQDLLDAAGRAMAGTGTPIPELRGIARENATMAVLGNGPKYAGGEGIAGGVKNLSRAERRVALSGYGVTAATTIALIGTRYLTLVRKQRKLDRESKGTAG